MKPLGPVTGMPLCRNCLRHRSELKAVAAEFPDVSMGSYPYHDERGWGTNLVVRGLDADRVAVAMAELKRRLSL